MKDKAVQRKGGQQGTALLLVLAALSIGSLIITPTINYVYTGFSQADIAEDYINDQYTADAALEYTLWQLQYDPDVLLDGLTFDTSTETTATVNGTDVLVVVAITQSPLGAEWPFPIPALVQGIHLDTILELGPPVPSGDGVTSIFPHRVYVFNSGTSTVHLKDVFQRLDPRLTYVAGSFTGPDAVLTEEYIDFAEGAEGVNHWELLWVFSNPEPTLASGEATFFDFNASTAEEMDEDTYVGEGWVSYAAKNSPQEEVFIGEYEPGAVTSRFDITINVGGYTILVSVGVTEDGNVVILSYQIL